MVTTCEEAFSSLRKTLATPQVLTRRSSGETLYLYLVVSKVVVNAILIKEYEAHYKLVYLILKVP